MVEAEGGHAQRSGGIGRNSGCCGCFVFFLTSLVVGASWIDGGGSNGVSGGAGEPGGR